MKPKWVLRPLLSGLGRLQQLRRPHWIAVAADGAVVALRRHLVDVAGLRILDALIARSVLLGFAGLSLSRDLRFGPVLFLVPSWRVDDVTPSRPCCPLAAADTAPCRGASAADLGSSES
jgi:hypothetical protein